jgi:hypothetical protein
VLLTEALDAALEAALEVDLAAAAARLEDEAFDGSNLEPAKAGAPSSATAATEQAKDFM